MPPTAGSVCLRAAMHLNDSSQLVYTTPVLIPYLAMAVDELEEELAVFEVTMMRKNSITIEVAAGALLLAQYPADYVEAIRMFERADGSSTDWMDVKEVLKVDQNYDTAQGIEYWSAENGLIRINPPTSARDVYLEYIAMMTEPTTSATAIDIPASRRFLGLVTARNAARDAGNSKTKADMFKEDIDRSRDRIVRRFQKNIQHVSGVRRRPYRGRSY